MIRREAINTGGDAWEGDASQARLGGKAQRVCVTGTQFLDLAALPTIPNRADGVNDMPCLQSVAFRYFRFTGLAPS